MEVAMHPKQSVDERFWKKVEKRGDDECWEWKAYRKDGYGLFAYYGAHIMAHRWSYERAHGPIPRHLTLDHLCRNRMCVNPAHLEVVTIRENTLRGFGPSANNARKTHCP